MNTAELLQQVKYILDDQGNPTVVQMDIELCLNRSQRYKVSEQNHSDQAESRENCE